MKTIVASPNKARTGISPGGGGIDLPKGVMLVYDRPLVPLHPLDVEFVNAVKLRGFATSPAVATAGGILTIYLGWQAQTDRLNGAEKVTVRKLLNDAGQLVAQQDRTLSLQTLAAVDSATELYAIALPVDLATGNYRLLVGLYDPAQTGAPRINTLEGSDAVELGKYQLNWEKYR